MPPSLEKQTGRMIRNDIHGVEKAPKVLQDYLTRKGGKNPYGEPNYRLVLSSNRLKQQGGRWMDWDNSVSIHDRGGVNISDSGLILPSQHKPWRTVEEIRSLPKYVGLEGGWVVERWVPAVYYGSRDAWYARTVPGTKIPFGGPFPDCGDYEMCHFASVKATPSISELQNVIDRCEAAREQLQGTVEQQLRDRLHEAERCYEQEREKERKEMSAEMYDVIKPLWGTSLAAGRYRNELAKRCGITEHVGN